MGNIAFVCFSIQISNFTGNYYITYSNFQCRNIIKSATLSLFQDKKKTDWWSIQKSLAKGEIENNRRWSSNLYLVDYGWPKSNCNEELHLFAPTNVETVDIAYFCTIKKLHYTKPPYTMLWEYKNEAWNSFLCFVLSGHPISLNSRNFMYVLKTLINFKGSLPIFYMEKNGRFLWHNLYDIKALILAWLFVCNFDEIQSKGHIPRAQDVETGQLDTWYFFKLILIHNKKFWYGDRNVCICYCSK